jgi:hypothetical protein
MQTPSFTARFGSPDTTTSVQCSFLYIVTIQLTITAGKYQELFGVESDGRREIGVETR